ncbi:MAG: S8 family serine peptidase [Actinomycetota bacterium]
MRQFDVRVHRLEDVGPLRDWLRSNEIAVAGIGGKKVRVYILEDLGVEARIAALPDVATVEEYIPPKLHNDFARRLLGIDDPNNNPPLVIQQEGDGQIVGVADTGLDEDHPDLNGRIVGVVALGRANDATDPHGHGTHVSGSILGDGTASGGTVRGVAPKARLFFQSLLDAQGGLGGLPVNLGDLFDEAYQQGVRIHNNSWGSAVRSMYTGDASDVDEFVASHRDMLIVFSAGNEGKATDRLNSQAGFVDWLSVGSPASSKNSLAVGASRSSRTSGGLAGLTWGQGWPQEFPDPPIADENISGDAESLAAFSSRGPCDDKRIKPDVVAPGTDIVSTKSSRAPLRNFWAAYPGNGQYAFLGGTSMAAPIVAGAATLVREYYVKDRQIDPSAALLKASLMNCTRWLSGADATADFQLMPNFHQGFGRIYLPWAIPNPLVPWFGLEVVDTWQDVGAQFQQSGQRLRFQVDVTGGDWLRICLAWTDLPAGALQNNLDLFVQDPSGAKHMGNADLPMSLHIPDPENHVELVRLEQPAPGTYLIQVSATNILRGPQDMALVVAGSLGSGLTSIS